MLDVRDNHISDPAVVDEVLAKIPKLKVVYMQSNPVKKKIKYYRRTMTIKIKGLTYLDDRPVFKNDRRTTEAFWRGGFPEERRERAKIK